MIKEGKAEKRGIDAYNVLKTRPELAYENRSSGEPVIPADLMSALKKEPLALQNFTSFPPSARRLYIDWLNSAKKPETRPGRINRIVDASRNNRKPGIM
jgi:uncharacterized protein YdeI (YjbR/CyaY-like superfamily)